MALLRVIIMQKLFSLWILSALALPAWSAETRYELRVDGLACPYCAYGIEKKMGLRVIVWVIFHAFTVGEVKR